SHFVRLPWCDCSGGRGNHVPVSLSSPPRHPRPHAARLSSVLRYPVSYPRIWFSFAGLTAPAFARMTERGVYLHLRVIPVKTGIHFSESPDTRSLTLESGLASLV